MLKLTNYLFLIILVPLALFFLLKHVNFDPLSSHGALLGYFSAIVGGLLSGFITLAGVNKTIKHQNIEKYLETYPVKIKEILNIKSLIRRAKSDSHYQLDILNKNQDLFYELEIATSKVNAKLYKEARALERHFKEIFKNFDDDFPVRIDEITGDRISTKSRVEVERIYRAKCTEKLDEFLEKVTEEESSLEKLVEKYQP